MKVSINIVTYNAEKYIRECLGSVKKQTHTDIDILVIDNGSQDKTLEKIKGIKVIKNKENLGFSKGHNIGIKESKGEYVLCLNQDAVLDKDFIKNCLKIDAGAVQGKVYKINDIRKRKKDIIDTTGLVMLKNRRVISRGQGREDIFNKQEEIFGADGSVPFYSKKALEDIKIEDEYFDEDFFAYKEDIDLSWRLRLYGWKIVYQPKAIAYHLRGAGDSEVRSAKGIIKQRRKISKFAKFHSFKNQRLMQIKNELKGLFFRDILYIIIREIGAWAYVVFFEAYTWKAIKELFKLAPNAFRKRKIIMENKKLNNRQMSKWFK